MELVCQLRSLARPRTGSREKWVPASGIKLMLWPPHWGGVPARSGRSPGHGRPEADGRSRLRSSCTTPSQSSGMTGREWPLRWRYDFGSMNSTRLPVYHRLDLRITRRFDVGRGVLDVYLDLFNAYNQQNLRSFDYSTELIDQELRYVRYPDEELLPFLPSLGLRWEFWRCRPRRPSSASGTLSGASGTSPGRRPRPDHGLRARPTILEEHRISGQDALGEPSSLSTSKWMTA